MNQKKSPPSQDALKGAFSFQTTEILQWQKMSFENSVKACYYSCDK